MNVYALEYVGELRICGIHSHTAVGGSCDPSSEQGHFHELDSLATFLPSDPNGPPPTWFTDLSSQAFDEHQVKDFTLPDGHTIGIG